MKLAFHYHVPALERDGLIWMPGYLARFVDSLAERVDQLYCLQHTPLPSESARCDTSLQSRNAQLVSLGPHKPVPVRLMKSGGYRRALKRIMPSLNLLLIRGPTPLLPLFGRLALSSGVPVALLLVGDYVRGVPDLPQPRWRKELIRAWCVWNKAGQNRVARESLVLVNSRQLFLEYQQKAAKTVETRTTTLHEHELFRRADTCQGRPIKLLYAGRYAMQKGLLHILKAMKLLIDKGLDLEWHLAGWEEEGTGVVKRLMTEAGRMRLAERVVEHGMKRAGEDLLRMYRETDVFVIGSRTGFEGFPRTIWEAMASSTPVVATKVGSIPQFLEDERHAVLVEPGSSSALAKGIEKVITDGALRRRLIANGFELAAENTVDKRAEELVRSLDSWRRRRPGGG